MSSPIVYFEIAGPDGEQVHDPEQPNRAGHRCHVWPFLL